MDRRPPTHLWRSFSLASAEVGFLSSATLGALSDLIALNATAEDPAAVGEAHLLRLRLIRQAQSLLKSEPAVLESVRLASESGSDWDQIAEASGLQPAAAKWRWLGTDNDIAARHAAGRKRSERPSSVPADLPGQSVADAARTLGVTAQAIYLRISRGTLTAETVTLENGRKYKRVLLP